MINFRISPFRSSRFGPSSSSSYSPCRHSHLRMDARHLHLLRHRSARRTSGSQLPVLHFTVPVLALTSIFQTVADTYVQLNDAFKIIADDLVIRAKSDNETEITAHVKVRIIRMMKSHNWVINFHQIHLRKPTSNCSRSRESGDGRLFRR